MESEKRGNRPRDFIIEIIKENKKELIKITLIATIGAIIVATIPYLYGRLFDLATIPDSSINLILILILLWLTLDILSTYAVQKTAMEGEITSQKIALEVESRAYGHFLTLPISFHKEKQKGEILNKISRGSWELSGLIENSSEVLPHIFMLIFSLIIITWIEWRLSVIMFVFFFIYTILTIKMTKPIMDAKKKEHKEFEKQYGKVYNKLYNVFLVKNFVMEEKERKSFYDSLVGKITPQIKERVLHSRRLSTAQAIIQSVNLIAVLGTSIFLLRQNYITAGEFVMFFGYVNMAFRPFIYFNVLYRRFQGSSVAVKRFLRLKEIVPDEMKHGEEVIKNLKGEIKFDNIYFKYAKGSDVLKGINLEIKPGETIALVGKSGMGKTTLSELVLGYYRPQKGEIKLDRINISRLKLSWMRDQMAVVPQDINLFNDTLINNLKYAHPEASFKEITEAAKAAAAHDFILKLPKGYNTKVGEDGVKLSMGQRQRIAITMAFLKNPKILILDEPTSALDAESEKKVQEGISKLIEGRTTLIIAHRFSTLRDADRIVVLDKGRIAEIGSHKELIRKKGIYYKLYFLQRNDKE